MIPTATYQAYNTWGGKSLYFDKNGGADTVAGTKRAVKVSFNRPQDDPTRQRDGYFGPDFDMVQWLEEQGYDVTYTDDVAVHQDPTELRQHEVVLITGHSEYWSSEEFNGVKAARDAGVGIASFSANTAYWKVRYENGNRRLVCYKTVQGDGSGSSGRVSANDWGPDGLENTADDALGLDRLAGTADDHPENSTTTFRDNGAPPGDPNAPVPGRVGPDMPENQLFGVMYFGDNDSHNYALRSVFFVFTREPLKGIPLEDELIAFCQNSKEKCPIRPSTEVWEGLQAQMQEPLKTDKTQAYGKSETPGEQQATHTRVGISERRSATVAGDDGFNASTDAHRGTRADS